VYALPTALDAVLALDRPGLLADAYDLHELIPGGRLAIGPFRARTRLLPHSLPNVGVRLAAGDRVFAYTGDCGAGDDVVDLALGADLLLADASYADEAPADARPWLGSGPEAGRWAAASGAARLVLTHLLPGTDAAAARAAAAARYGGDIDVATPGWSAAL
jgi:ribonuclease BN (tRNA processing enzyme)